MKLIQSQQLISYVYLFNGLYPQFGEKQRSKFIIGDIRLNALSDFCLIMHNSL
jgi:hypothetical protein